MTEIKVFGHKSPDTDSTCAPIVWAWYLSERCGQPATPYLLGKPNTEALFLLDYWKQKKPELLGKLTKEDYTIIVDTNNPQELPENVNETNIIEIIDHHKLVGGIQTSSPINITIRPLACTTTVMFQLMDSETRENLPKEIAGLMLSAIISDTLEFRSPTTTETDQEIAEILAEIAEVKISELAKKMFEAKSDVSHFSDKELILLDSKKYEIKEKKMRVSVIETTLPEIVLNRKDGIIKTMTEVQNEENLDQVLFFIVDILKEECTFLAPNDFVKKLAKDAFGIDIEGDFVVIPELVSRKKQIIPALEA